MQLQGYTHTHLDIFKKGDFFLRFILLSIRKGSYCIQLHPLIAYYLNLTFRLSWRSENLEGAKRYTRPEIDKALAYSKDSALSFPASLRTLHSNK